MVPPVVDRARRNRSQPAVSDPLFRKRASIKKDRPKSQKAKPKGKPMAGTVFFCPMGPRTNINIRIRTVFALEKGNEKQKRSPAEHRRGGESKEIYH